MEAVWRALTDPVELGHWFPSAVTVDLRVGGGMTFTFQDGSTFDGEVKELDPPHRLAFSWGRDHLQFELEPTDGGRACMLRFTVLLDERNKAARDAAGWHVCLDRLERLLAGASHTAPATGATQDWREHYEDYSRRGLPTGAPIPGK